MANTHKDKANYYKHHKEHNNPYYVKKDKHKIDPADIPAYLKPLIDKLDHNYAGNRHGNNRNMHAQAKVFDRREKRNKDKEFVRDQVKEYI